MTINMGLVFLLVAFASVLLLLMAGDLSYWARRIWRIQRQHHRWLRKPSFSLSLSLSGVRRPGPLRVELWEIRDFLVGLQLALSLEEGLAGALHQMAEQFAGRGVFGQRLVSHVESKAAIAPEEVLQGLVEDFHSEQIREAMKRLTLARDTGLSYVEAMALSVEAVEHEIKAEVGQEISRASDTLLIPLAVGVFLPALVLGLYPVIYEIITSIGVW